jgi:glycosyltransferase involved in cell wall biosynthesis
MRILVIPSWFPSEKDPFNGNFVERHVQVIAKNHEVFVLHFVSDNVTEISREIIEKENYSLIEIKFPVSKNRVALTFSFYKILKEIRNSLDPVDLIHGHVILEKGLIFLLAKFIFNKPLYISEHASYLIRSNYKKLTSKLQKK